VFVLGFSGCDSSKDFIGEGDPGTKEPGGADISVSLNPNTLYLGLETGSDSATLEATVSPANAANKAVTWESSDKTVAKVNADGKVTSVAEGTATVTVTTAAGKKTATCEVTVQSGMVKAEVSLDPEKLDLAVGKAETLDLTVNPDTAKVQWTSSDTGIATVDKDGKVRGVKAGSATVTVTAVYGGDKATCALTVKSDTTPPANVTGLAGTPGNGQVVLSWTDPKDVDLDHIEVTRTPGGTAAQTVNKGIQTYTATGLTNGTAYTLTVKAVDTVGNRNTGATVTNTPAPAAPGTLVSDTTTLKGKSIKMKFEGSEGKKGKEGVEAAFLELSAFISGGGLTDNETQNVIQLGNYIDLEGGLSVAAYGAGGGGFSSSDEGMYWDADITINGLANDRRKMQRLIVVGINSFNDKNGNGTTPHVVFQFQHIPVLRRMNATNDNTGGYPASEMREYLTPTGNADSGKFLAGLIKAGLPKDVLWPPRRVMATAADALSPPLDDLLWLPTEREMSGIKINSSAAEDEANQVRLEYYDVNGSRRKANKDTDSYPAVQSGKEYWVASACYQGVGNDGPDVRFCGVNGVGNVNESAGASTALGVSPAFCVQGWLAPAKQ
jgi:hypothetical protein